MRFVLAIVLFVVAFVAIGLGVAQRTIFLGPDHLTATVDVDAQAPFTVLDGASLNSHDGRQMISISGSGTVFMAYGRTDDVQAWVGDASSTAVSYDADTQELVADTIAGSEATSPSPAGSDLWIQEFSGEDELVRNINVPADVSVLIASDGTAAAPGEISVTWPLDNSTPWSSPLIVAGIGALLLGLIALLWALVHARRRHGPRRKTPKMPKPPRPAQLKPAPRRPAIAAGAPVSRGRRRAFTALPLVLVGVVTLTACSADGSLGPSATPAATDAAVAEVDPPVVTERQFTRIVSEISEAVTAADEARDATAAATRLAGPALALRTANYTARGTDAAIPAVAAFPTGTVELILPQQRHEWPRVVFATVPGDADAEYAGMFVQDSPREQYKVHYLVRLTQSVPEVAPVELGSARLAPDNKLLAYTPDQLAAEYGDILINGDASEFADHFDAENDILREKFGADYKTQRRADLSTATVDFTSQVGDEEPYAFATNDTGAIVAVDLRETETVRPAEAGAAINPSGAVKALSGKTTSTKGISAQYGMQVLFYVPPVTADDQTVRVLGFTQGLVAAAEVA
ncbi:hypothetical protein [Protaetiibacter intestinalis]|uniref:DUF8094 domain-containing protein n=1 Tax=Protaetiibacter intestinalis TaxID=2419774 RepID=A0A387B8E8_9MICO|nr:hypothetical protein [Protaetiibacter intestinalis]AYF98627.1 hypothetical protein D7I47_10385 [Protaetiibacter intestinalis]